MTVDEFTATSISLLRSAVGWQSRIARELGIDDRTVRRWLKARQIPDWVGPRLIELAGGTLPFGEWPRDEWLIGEALGEDGKRREYVAHLRTPRFIARIVSCDPDGSPEPDERPADVLDGIVYSIDEGTVLCEFAWIDAPDPGEVTALMEGAANAIEAIDEA